MARKKTVKDVEVEEVSKKKKAKDVEEEVVEEVEEVEETEDFEGNDDVEEPKKEKKETKKEHKEKKEGFFSKVRREMRKVVWPTLWEITKYSVAVIIFCVVLCLFFLGINAIASLVKGLFM